MAGIQAGINQLIGQGAILAHLSPGLRARAEKREALGTIKRKEKVLGTQLDIASTEQQELTKDLEKIQAKVDTSKEPMKKLYTAMEDTTAKDLTKNVGLQADITKKQAELAAQKFDIDPTEKTYKELTKASDVAGFTQDMKADILQSRETRKITREEAMQKMATKGRDQVKQRQARRNFMKALSGEQVSFGAGAEGKVGDLPKNVQKQIASGFTKAERKELMDKYYGCK